MQRDHAWYLDPMINYPKNKTKELVLHSHLSLVRPPATTAAAAALVQPVHTDILYRPYLTGPPVLPLAARSGCLVPAPEGEQCLLSKTARHASSSAWLLPPPPSNSLLLPPPFSYPNTQPGHTGTGTRSSASTGEREGRICGGRSSEAPAGRPAGLLLVPFVVCQVHQGLVGDMVGTVDWCRGALGCQEGDQ